MIAAHCVNDDFHVMDLPFVSFGGMAAQVRGTGRVDTRPYGSYCLLPIA
jgi:hypothetical protein